MQKNDSKENRGSSEIVKRDKIGIFGWTGTGKTTFLVMLYYLLSSGKIPNSTMHAGDKDRNKDTIRYLLPKIKEIKKASSWKEVSESIVGTMDSNIPPLNFDISIKGKKAYIQTIDYPGEMVEVEKSNERIDNFLTNCDALMLFLGLEEARSSGEDYFRQNEFGEFLNKITQSITRNCLDIPIVLVVTKYDLVQNKPSTIEELVENYLHNEYNKIKEYCKKVDVVAISSKECFEYYIKRDQFEEEFPEFYSENIHAQNVSLPLLIVLDRFRKKIRQEKMMPFKKALLAALSILIILYGGLFAFTKFYSINKLEKFADANPNDKYSVYQKYNEFYQESIILTIFPFIKENIKNKSESVLNIAEDDHYKEIEIINKKYNEVIMKLNEYSEQYSKEKEDIAELKAMADKIMSLDKERDELYNKQLSSYKTYNQRYSKVAKHMKQLIKMNDDAAEKKKAIDILKAELEEDKVYYMIDMLRSDYNKAIELCGIYLDKYPKGKYKDKVIEIHAEASNKRDEISRRPKPSPTYDSGVGYSSSSRGGGCFLNTIMGSGE